jgi:hypothetical protein
MHAQNRIYLDAMMNSRSEMSNVIIGMEFVNIYKFLLHPPPNDHFALIQVFRRRSTKQAEMFRGLGGPQNIINPSHLLRGSIK